MTIQEELESFRWPNVIVFDESIQALNLFRRSIQQSLEFRRFWDIHSDDFEEHYFKWHHY